MDKKISFYIRLLTAILICFSILVTFYSKIVLNDYEIIRNPDGPDLEA